MTDRVAAASAREPSTRPWPERTCPFRPLGLPTSRPYAIEPTGEIVTCLQRKCANFVTIRPQVAVGRAAPAPTRGGRRAVASTVARSGHAADRRQRARVDRRRDGDDDLPHRALDRRARRDGLLRRALRRGRRDGRAGGDRAVPPRLGAGRDGAPAREVGRPDAARRRVRDERPVRRRHPPAGHLRLQAGLPRRRRSSASRPRPRTTATSAGGCPGSAACDNTEIFQEGIRLPWLRLYDRGEPVEAVFEVIRANVRIPRMTLGDLAAQVAATTVAERALQELARRYGTERLAALMTGLIEHTERLVRQEIAGWPDGTATFTDYLDSDGIERRDVPDHRDRHDRRRRAHRRPARVVADGRGRAQLDALVHPGVRLPGGALGARGRDPEHVRRVPADPRADEAGHDLRGRDAGRVVDARRHRLPRARRDQRRARAADPGARAGGGRGRQHARGLRRRPARRPASAFIFYELDRRHVGRHAASATATTASRTRRASRRTSRSRSPSPSSRS